MSLRPDRLAVLRLIAEGKRPEVQRTRLKWLVDNGWLVAHDGAAPGYRAVTLPEQSWTALEIQGDPTVPYTLRPQLGGYRSDQVRRTGRP